MRRGAPQVSIGMPVYNGERFLREAVDSILGQTFEDFELIISDNGSADRTREICEEYAARDRRVRYYRNERNVGAAKNFARVFELASGEYFKWAAYDDVCAPALIERCVEVLNRMPSVVLSYARTVIIDVAGRPVKKWNDNLNLRSPRASERYRRYHERFHHDATCYPLFGVMLAHVLRRTPLLPGYIASDQILLGELALRGEFYEVPEYLFFQRDHVRSSVQGFPAFRDRIRWYDPEKSGRFHLTRWRWLWEYAKSIRRVKLEPTERALCYFQCARWAIWNARGLVEDLVEPVLWPVMAGYFRRVQGYGG